MKIEMRRTFGNSTLTLSDEADDAVGVDRIIKTMMFHLNAAEEGPKISDADLKAARAARTAEGGEGKVPQGACVNPAPAQTSQALGPNPAPSPEMDAVGAPWDARYHAETRNKTADGRWKIRRGLSPADRERAEAIRTGKGWAMPQ